MQRRPPSSSNLQSRICGLNAALRQRSKVRVIATCVVMLLPASLLHAQQAFANCLIDEVAVFENRVHLRCKDSPFIDGSKTPYSSARYFAVDLNRYPFLAKSVVDLCYLSTIAFATQFGEPPPGAMGETIVNHIRIRMVGCNIRGFTFEMNPDTNLPPGCLRTDCRRLTGIVGYFNK